jgi:hypothetical protein
VPRSRNLLTSDAARHAPRGVLLGGDTTRYPSLVGLACRRPASPCDDRHAPGRRRASRNIGFRALARVRPGSSFVASPCELVGGT